MRWALSGIESELMWARHDLQREEARRSTAEFNAHIQAQMQRSRDLIAAGIASRRGINERYGERVIIVYPQGAIAQQPQRRHPIGWSPEGEPTRAMFAAIERSGAKISPDLLRKATHAADANARRKARNEIFALIRQHARRR
jgi:hypothetical protein